MLQLLSACTIKKKEVTARQIQALPCCRSRADSNRADGTSRPAQWWNPPLVQCALMDRLFGHNICGERPHEHTSFITPAMHTHTHKLRLAITPIPVCPPPPETSYSQHKENTRTSVLYPSSTAEVTSSSSPLLLLHPPPPNTHTHTHAAWQEEKLCLPLLTSPVALQVLYKMSSEAFHTPALSEACP